jgi:hypothetical protein
MGYNRLAPQRYKRLQMDFVRSQMLWSADDAVLENPALGVEWFLVPDDQLNRQDTTQGLLIDSTMFLEIDNSMNLDFCMLEFAGEYSFSTPADNADNPWRIDMDVAGKPFRSKRVDSYAPAAEFLPPSPIISDKWGKWHNYSTGHVGNTSGSNEPNPGHGYGYDLGLFSAGTTIFPTQDFIAAEGLVPNIGDRWHFVFPIGHGFPAVIGTAGFRKLYILLGLRLATQEVNNTEYRFSMRLAAHQYERKLVC